MLIIEDKQRISWPEIFENEIITQESNLHNLSRNVMSEQYNDEFLKTISLHNTLNTLENIKQKNKVIANNAREFDLVVQ